MSLLKVLEALAAIVEAIKNFTRMQKVQEIKDAKNESLEKNDQRELENKLGGSSGPATDDKYPGMSTRERQKKE
jgi:hypothetical protein